MQYKILLYLKKVGENLPLRIQEDFSKSLNINLEYLKIQKSSSNMSRAKVQTQAHKMPKFNSNPNPRSINAQTKSRPKKFFLGIIRGSNINYISFPKLITLQFDTFFFNGNLCVQKKKKKFIVKNHHVFKINFQKLFSIYKMGLGFEKK